MAEERKTFSSSLGLILSCLGCVVGTGNIWRFPRIVALTASGDGSLSFIIAWLIFLLMWSMPMITTEYAMGRYCKGGPLTAFRTFVGPWAGWCGLWVAGVTILIGCYYIVIQGWCFYYVYRTIGFELPTNGAEALEIFNTFSNSNWPILTQGIGLILSAACTIGGIGWIEKANMFFMPVLLVILIFTFGWSLSLDYSDYALRTMFNPNFGKMADPDLWINAATQNAFDTSAALGLFLTYASYMSAHDSVVKYSIFIPLGNNLVSLVCGMTIFNTAFSTLIDDKSMSRAGILEIMKNNGPGGTGLTFVWLPVLLSQANLFGRVIAVLFFICLSFAGFSSTISILELATVTLKEVGVPSRKLATVLLTVVMFAIGFGSSWSTLVLTNQDSVWGFAILISGLFLQFAVAYYGVFRFRKTVVNDFGLNDWRLPALWAIVIQFIAPLEALGLLAWWIYNNIRSNPDTWYIPSVSSLMTVIIEWIALFLIALISNLLLVKFNSSWKFSQMSDEDVERSSKTHSDAGIEAGSHDNAIYMCWDNAAYDKATDGMVDQREPSPCPEMHSTPRPVPRMSVGSTDAMTAL